MLNLFAAGDDAKPVTHLLAVDLSSVTGTKLLHEAIRYLVDEAIAYHAYSNMLFILFSSDYVFLFNTMQMDGSNRARVGLLLYARSDSVSTILLMKDIIDRTISSFRFVPLFSFPFFPFSSRDSEWYSLSLFLSSHH